MDRDELNACHRMFRTPQRDVHVHVWADDDPEVEAKGELIQQLLARATD